MSERNRLLIFGDAMIDTYLYGSVSRISPEAPVPVVQPWKKTHCLGGAANVAQNAASLGADVRVMFVVGKDENAAIMKRELRQQSIDCSLLCEEEDQRTIHKMRIVGNDQQMIRVDWHDGYSLSKQTEQRLLDKFYQAVTECDGIVISDYGKGTCTPALCQEIISCSRSLGKTVIVDPKGTDWKKYRGASVITPNLKEMNLYSGMTIPNDAAHIELAYKGMNRELGIDYLLITRSECGMSLLDDKGAVHFSAWTHEVYDVSGAGDTVVAALAAVLDSGMENLIDSVEIANIAAGIVVAKPGTAKVTRGEIQDAIAHSETDNSSIKIYTIQEYDRLLQMVNFWRTAGEKIVTTNGCFDIIHRGHIRLLEKAEQRGTRLIVAVNSDASVRRLKGDSRPVNNERDRAYILSMMKMVDAVVIFDPEKTPYRLSEIEMRAISGKAAQAAREAPMALMKMIAPDVHVKGGEYRIEDIPEALFAKETVLVRMEEGYSTTNVIHKAGTLSENEK